MVVSTTLNHQIYKNSTFDLSVISGDIKKTVIPINIKRVAIPMEIKKKCHIAMI